METFLFNPSMVLAVLPEYPTLGQSFGFILIGFSVVMVALATLWFLTSTVGTYFRKAAEAAAKATEAAKAAEKAAAAAAQSAGQANAAEGRVAAAEGAYEDAEEGARIAAVAAAIAVVVGAPHRVVKIKPVLSGWSQEGRRQIFDSHQVR